MEEVRYRRTRENKKYSNEKLRDLYSSPNNLLLIKSRGTKPAGQVTRMRDNVDLMRKLVDKNPTEKLILRYDL
jgi:hypothetical protein